MAELTRWDPLVGLTSMHTHIDDMFNDFFSTNWSHVGHAIPAVDVYTEDEDKKFVAEAHLPGFDRDDVEVNLHDGMLEVRGEKHVKDADKKNRRNYMIRESYASFYRSVALPKAADSDHVKATFNNGILKVIVPMKKLPEPKHVAIEANTKR